jgi:uncharacterized repeat protein (TIGR03803 family)
MFAETAGFSYGWRKVGNQTHRASSHRNLTILLMALVSATLIFFARAAVASTETVLHTFTSKSGLTFSGVVIDKAGNLYGTTFDGGTFGKGTVYQLSLAKTGKWTYSVIHNFANDGRDGTGPGGANLVLDSNGNLYGSTNYGGSGKGCKSPGCGTVFKLTRNGKIWTETILYSFQGGKDGSFPQNLAFDSQGILYSTTGAGGKGLCSNNQQSTGCGTVFKLRPSSKGIWTKTTLYSFQGLSEGQYPVYGVVLDSAGNLYGVTVDGGFGASTCAVNGYVGCGTVFALMHSGKTWTHSVLYSFVAGNDGQWPSGPLVFDKLGKLYGMTDAGGGSHGGRTVICNLGCGTVFELSPAGGGTWTESVIHSFSGDEGATCQGGVIFDNTGNLYGTAQLGGAYGDGTVFKLRYSGTTWLVTVLHSFQYAPTDGADPANGVIFDNAGNLYSTTLLGGIGNPNSVQGTVFKIAP